MRGPNVILQASVGNSLLHGLKNKGYRGTVSVSAKRAENPEYIEIMISDTGSGFADGVKEQLEDMLSNYDKKAPKLEGNSIGLLNVQKRIKLLSGRDCGLSYTENPEGGVTAHLLLRPGMEEGQ